MIGKTGKDIPADKVSEYIAGYTVADDVSNRQWQTDPKFAGIAPQWCFCKGFDNFSPLGPAIVSNKVSNKKRGGYTVIRDSLIMIPHIYNSSSETALP